MRKLLFLALTVASLNSYAFLGTEIAPLLKLVAGQVKEIEALSEEVGLSKENLALLTKLNEGIGKTTRTIERVENIVERAQGLDPSSIKSLSDLTSLIKEVKSLNKDVSKLLLIKTEIAEEAVLQAGIQSETSYKMGQEMIEAGTELNLEAKTASPGRAAQITAAGQAGTLISNGVELQTLSQMAQLQAVSLELQRSVIEKDARAEETQRKTYFDAIAKRGNAK